jgi:hypothetical protein
MSEKDILALIDRLKQKITRKMNLERLAGLVIFVLLFSITSHSLTNSAFAINTSHEKPMTAGVYFYKINVNVPKDPSVEEKAKEAKEKAEAEINHLKEIAKSKLKGYSE